MRRAAEDCVEADRQIDIVLLEHDVRRPDYGLPNLHLNVGAMRMINSASFGSTAKAT